VQLSSKLPFLRIGWPVQYCDAAGGDYVYVPKEVAHFDSCKGETVLYAHGIGPLEFNWVNPVDDPAKSAKPQ